MAAGAQQHRPGEVRCRRLLDHIQPAGRAGRVAGRVEGQVQPLLELAARASAAGTSRTTTSKRKSVADATGVFPGSAAAGASEQGTSAPTVTTAPSTLAALR